MELLEATSPRARLEARYEADPKTGSDSSPKGPRISISQAEITADLHLPGAAPRESPTSAARHAAERR